MMQYVLDLSVFVSGVISPTSNSAGTKVELYSLQRVLNCHDRDGK